MTKVSILMSLYHKESPQYLKRSILSVTRDQRKKPDELVVVIDGPIGDDLSEALRWSVERCGVKVKKVLLRKNMGLGVALNAGIKACSNELIARMDTDDIAFPCRIARQVAFMETHPDVAASSGYAVEFDRSGDKRIRPVPIENIPHYCRLWNPMAHPATIFRKSAVVAVGSYSHQPLFEDYLLWVKLIMSGFTLANLKAPLIMFRMDDPYGRRRGWTYLVKEWRFFYRIYRMGFIDEGTLAINLTTKTILRLLPGPLLVLFYRSFMRRDYSVADATWGSSTDSSSSLAKGSRAPAKAVRGATVIRPKLPTMV